MPSTFALVLVTGVGPFATDTYISGLPSMQQSLGTSATVTQLTLTAFIAGLAAGQFLLGPISDGRGRRGLQLACAVTFTVTSAICVVAPNGPVLVAARLAQGIAAGGGVVIARAVVTDSHSGSSAAAKFGTLASITFLGPVIAPALGGLILTFSTWRAVFVLLTVLGVAMVISVLAGVPETLPVERRQSAGLRDNWSRTLDLVRDWAFMRHVVVYCLTAAGFFTYIGGSAYVLQTAYQVTPGLYSIVFAVNAAAMAVTGLVFRLLVTRVGPARLRGVGIAISTTAAVGLLLVAVLDPTASGPLALPWVLFCLVVGGTGLTVPATTALAQEAGRRSAGTAAALQGGLGFLVGAVVSPLTGVLGYDSLLPMAVAMATFYVLGLALMITVGAPSRTAARQDAG